MTRPPKQYSRLSCQVNPVGASIYIDGTWKGNSPCLIDSILPGQHIVRIDSGIHYVAHSETLTFIAGKKRKMIYTMARMSRGFLCFTSNPEQLDRLMIQDIETNTDTILQNIRGNVRLSLAMGTYDINAEREYFEPFQKRVVIESGQDIPCRAVLRPFGELSVEVLPDCDIYIDHVLVKKNHTFLEMKLKEGNHLLTIKKANMKMIHNCERDTSYNVNIEMVHHDTLFIGSGKRTEYKKVIDKGILDINVQGKTGHDLKDLGVKVFIGGVECNRLSISLFEGVYEVEVRKEGFRSREGIQKVEIIAGKSNLVTFTLLPI
jgi:hypothetical protein